MLLAKGAKPGSKDGQHQESGGSKGERPGDTKADPVKGLDARQKEYYSEGIKRGRYKDWDAVREELKFQRKRA